MRTEERSWGRDKGPTARAQTGGWTCALFLLEAAMRGESVGTGTVRAASSPTSSGGTSPSLLRSRSSNRLAGGSWCHTNR